MTWLPFKRVATIRVSNVDKLSVEGELPVRLCNYTDVYYGDRLNDGLPYMEATATPGQVAAFALQADDVILTKDSETADDIGVSAFVPADLPDVVCGYHLAMLRPRPGLADGRYLYWTTCSTSSRDQFAVSATGVTRFGLRAESIGGAIGWFPAPRMQRAIADFLDAETARIDALIEKKRRMIDVSSERFEVTVYEAVEGRLTSRDQERRSSGLSWLTTVPHRWEVRPIGSISTVVLGKMLSPEAITGHDQHPYLRNTNVQWYRVIDDDLPSMSFDASERQRYRLEPHDLLVCEGGEVGRAAVWDGPSGIYIQKALLRVRMREQHNPRYLMYALRAAAMMQVFRVEGNQATIVHLTGEKLRAHRIPVPSPEEQGRVTQLLDNEKAQLNRLVVALSRQIGLLREHRQALITAAVTGELAVPGVAA